MVKDACRSIILKKTGDAEKSLKKFMVKMGPRGLATMLGLRKTVGSQDVVVPSAKLLLDGFNKPNQVLSVEEAQRAKSVSKLTVGGRGLLKHCHRTSDGFWGSGTGTEA